MDTYNHNNHLIHIREANLQEKMMAAQQVKTLNILEKLWVMRISGPNVNDHVMFPGGKGNAVTAAMNKIDSEV